MSELPKLVRDRIPERVRENGEVPVTHVADGAEYERRLREKLVEEAEEFAESGDVGELADVLAVVAAVREYRDLEAGELDAVREEKAARNGRFEDRVVLETVSQSAHNESV